jgi:hypothetical protein
MRDYCGPMPVDINPIRYNDGPLGFSARYEVTECGNSYEDYIEIRAIDPIPDRIFGAPLEGDRIVLPIEVAIKVAAVILRSNIKLAVGCCADKDEINTIRSALDGILGQVDTDDDEAPDDDEDFDDDDFDLDDRWFPTPCIDCDLELLPPHTPPGSKDWQQFMVHDEVWTAAGLDQGWICIDCLEKRLGRPLTGADLIPDLPINEPGRYDDTERLAQLKREAAHRHKNPADRN